MKRLFYFYILLTIVSIICVASCSKSSSGTNPTPTTPKSTLTITDTLDSKPWKLTNVAFINSHTLLFENVGVPDSLLNLVLTFKSNNSFTETGAKVASGAWTVKETGGKLITVSTTSAPTSLITYTMFANDTLLTLTNYGLPCTYSIPFEAYSYYGEGLSFSH